jgi:preprotein translocase subunit SecE
MARIQKKKTAQQQKKKKKGAIAAPAVTGKDEDHAGGGAAAAAPDAVREKKNKRVLPVKKPSGLDQSALMKKLDQYFGSWIQFFREVRIELSKVTWPSRSQTIGSTVVVIIFVFIIAIFLGMVDIGLSSLIRLII